MSSRKILLLAVTIAIWALTACNYTVGECWRRGEGSAGVGAGPGDWSGVGSSGSGDFGDAPGDQNNEEPPLECNKTDKTEKSSEENPQDTPKSPTDPCQQSGAPSMGCTGTKPISPLAFKFVTIIADDGTDVGGGWQEAKANLFFLHNQEGDAACMVRVGMPLRSEGWGKISVGTAALYTANVVNASADELYKSGGEDLPPGIFCERLKTDMKKRFPEEYRGLGARID